MKLDRTVKQFLAELDRAFGFKAALRRSGSGYFLEGPRGERASVGESSPNDLLSPRDQEALCENFGLDPSLLGLEARSQD